jgi:GT2 family glycosyltransferase
MSQPQRIDVIIPTYNYGRFLDQCLTAVTGQTRGDFSVLVIDNASEDDTPAIMARWLKRDVRVRYLRNDCNLGHVESMKKAYRLTGAEYVVVLPCDDLWQPSFLEQTAGALDTHPECTYAYTGWSNFFDLPDGEGHGPETKAWAPHRESGVVEDMTCLAIQNWIPLSFGLFRRSACDALGGFSPEYLPHIGDMLLWMRLSALGKAYFIKEPLGKIRTHGKNATVDLLASGRSAFEHIHVLDLVYQSDLWSHPVRLLAKASQIRLMTGMTLYESATRFGNEHTPPMIRDYLERYRDEFYVTVARCILMHLSRGSGVGTIEEAILLLKEALKISTDHVEAKTLLRSTKILESAEYPIWIRNHGLTESDAGLFAERMMLRWKQKPVFHLLMCLEPQQQALLADSINALSQSLYSEWRLTVVAPFGSPDPMFSEVPILRWIEAPEEAALDALNQAVAESDGEWFILIPPGLCVEAHALLRFGDYINLRPEWQLIYSDDDTVAPDGERFDPRFKPDFNLDMLRSTDYIGPAFVRRSALASAGGKAFLISGAETHDLALRILDAHGEASIGHVADVLLHLPEMQRPVVDRAHQLALTQHLARSGVAGKVSRSYLPGTFHIDYLHSACASVTIIIPNKNKIELLVACLNSVLDKTDYPNYDVIIVDNQSSDPELFNYYETVVARNLGKVRILAYPHPFNYSAICNQAAAEARGDYLLFLNNDTEIVHPEWLSQMMAHAQRPEVGIVGARLLFPESGKVQHAGVVVGMRLIAGHPFAHECGVNDPGYMNRALLEQNYSAVTGACQLVRKSLYEEVGGQDAVDLTVLYNDVDLCLKIVAAGYKVVWTPFATLLHHESVSQKSLVVDLEKEAVKRTRIRKEVETMLVRWLPVIAHDPAYNPNLSLEHRDMRVEQTMPFNWDSNFNDRKRILGFGSGVGAIPVFAALSRDGRAQCEIFRFPKGDRYLPQLSEMARRAPHVLVVHPGMDDSADTLYLEYYRRFLPGMKRLFMLDDLLAVVAEKNVADKNGTHIFDLAKTHLRLRLDVFDRLIVSTEMLADACRGMIDDICVIPDRLPREPWAGLVSLRNQGRKPRVGWVGTPQHQGELALIENVVEVLRDEIEWVFMGACPESARLGAAEVHDFVDINAYPAKLASLNLDLAIAPLEINPFNETKSNRRLLEYGILGWPVVCSDAFPYRSYDAPVTRVPNEAEAWIAAIRQIVADPLVAENEGQRLKQWVLDKFILEDHLDEWTLALLDN